MKKFKKSSDNKYFCTLEFEYETPEITKSILKSLEVDNYIFINSKQNGKKIISEIHSTSIPSLIHTIDDYLACISVAEKTINLVR